MLDFYKGVDISGLPQYLDEGMQIKDEDGTAMEPFALLKKHGANAVRLRIWNEPENEPRSKGYCDLAHTLEMAKKSKENGMSFLLNFHYSDFWADPANQRKPKAWEGLDREALEEAVFAYTRDTLLALERQGTLPDMVQIGNEIRSGLLFPEGELPDYEGMVRLVNAGIKGARAVAGQERMQVMIHLDQGGRYEWLHEWFEGAMAHGLLDFDLIGLSYYPFWHGTYLDLRHSLDCLLRDYNKPILIVETAYAWRESAKGFIDEEQIRISGLPATPEGQRRLLEAVMHLTASLPDKMGRGVYYWEPLCVPDPAGGGWAENMGLLDAEGRALEGIRAFAATRAEMEKEPNGWNELLARAQGTDVGAKLDRSGQNLLENGNFAHGLEGWQMETSEETLQTALKPELVVSSQKNFRWKLEQTIFLQEGGVYSLWVEFKGVDTTGVDVRLYAKCGEECYERVIHPTEHAWTAYEVRGIECPAGEVNVGVMISSPPICVSMRNFGFVRRGGCEER
ncbi:MAG: arabinogalactan endo-1,4-beta-galactosidase [Candidatus Gastranaerophilales bacterium]|nr:arabinogalactan endo-1,4-beta-galactosidase [Candidatus Gastranaerophilales bacterium]